MRMILFLIFSRDIEHAERQIKDRPMRLDTKTITRLSYQIVKIDASEISSNFWNLIYRCCELKWCLWGRRWLIEKTKHLSCHKSNFIELILVYKSQNIWKFTGWDLRYCVYRVSQWQCDDDVRATINWIMGTTEDRRYFSKTFLIAAVYCQNMEIINE